jgi:anti-sigma B factor antagonist
MTIEIKKAGSATIAVITGDIDSKTAPQAQAQLLSVIESTVRLVMDMSGVGFMSSAGLRMMLLMYRQATSKEGKIALVGLSDEIKDTMSMTGFLNFFVVADTLDEGLKAIG